MFRESLVLFFILVVRLKLGFVVDLSDEFLNHNQSSHVKGNSFGFEIAFREFKVFKVKFASMSSVLDLSAEFF